MKTMAYANTNQMMNDNDGRPGKFLPFDQNCVLVFELGNLKTKLGQACILLTSD